MLSTSGRASEGLRARKKERTREELIAAAVELFEEYGYENTTVDSIAEHAEYSTSTFFRYFGSKEEVVIGRLHEQLAGLRAFVEEHSDDTTDAFVLVRRFLTQHLLDLTVRASPAEAACRRLWTSEPTLMALYTRVNAEGEEILAGFLARRLGGPDAEVSVESYSMAIALLGVMRSVLVLKSLEETTDGPTVEAELARGFDMFEKTWSSLRNRARRSSLT